MAYLKAFTEFCKADFAFSGNESFRLVVLFVHLSSWHATTVSFIFLSKFDITTNDTSPSSIYFNFDQLKAFVDMCKAANLIRLKINEAFSQ